MLAQPPARVVEHLTTAVTQALTAGMEMLAARAAQPELFDMFRLRPDAELEFTRHAAERLTRYWGIEQTRLRNEVQVVITSVKCAIQRLVNAQDGVRIELVER